MVHSYIFIPEQLDPVYPGAQTQTMSITRLSPIAEPLSPSDDSSVAIDSQVPPLRHCTRSQDTSLGMSGADSSQLAPPLSPSQASEKGSRAKTTRLVQQESIKEGFMAKLSPTELTTVQCSIKLARAALHNIALMQSHVRYCAGSRSATRRLPLIIFPCSLDDHN